MKKEIILLLIVVIGVCLICGCVNQSQPVQQVSDDDLYIKDLIDFVTTSDQQQPTSDQFTQDQLGGAKLKIQSTTYYDRVVALKVSPKYEFSKKSFLQCLKEMEAISEYLLNKPDSMDMDRYLEAEKHNQNFGLFLIKTFDSNVCSVENEKKYTNITKVCKSFSP
jgi:hypothetical protein